MKNILLSHERIYNVSHKYDENKHDDFSYLFFSITMWMLDEGVKDLFTYANEKHDLFDYGKN